eukprot:scaffold20574_cov101-Isochrysis_galbana.AAC.3
MAGGRGHGSTRSHPAQRIHTRPHLILQAGQSSGGGLRCQAQTRIGASKAGQGVEHQGLRLQCPCPYLVPPDEDDGQKQHPHDEQKDGFDPVGAAEHRTQELGPAARRENARLTGGWGPPVVRPVTCVGPLEPSTRGAPAGKRGTDWGKQMGDGWQRALGGREDAGGAWARFKVSSISGQARGAAAAGRMRWRLTWAATPGATPGGVGMIVRATLCRWQEVSCVWVAAEC